MGSYQYVDFSVGYPFLYVADFLRGTKPADIFDFAWEILQPGLECLEVLERKDGGWHKDSYLLSVGDCLECSPYRDLCLSEADVSAYEPVHRGRILHIPLHGFGSLHLVGSILIHE